MSSSSSPVGRVAGSVLPRAIDVLTPWHLECDFSLSRPRGPRSATYQERTPDLRVRSATVVSRRRSSLIWFLRRDVFAWHSWRPPIEGVPKDGIIIRSQSAAGRDASDSSAGSRHTLLHERFSFAWRNAQSGTGPAPAPRGEPQSSAMSSHSVRFPPPFPTAPQITAPSARRPALQRPTKSDVLSMSTSSKPMITAAALDVEMSAAPPAELPPHAGFQVSVPSPLTGSQDSLPPTFGQHDRPNSAASASTSRHVNTTTGHSLQN